jgi:hypothetical protein
MKKWTTVLAAMMFVAGSYAEVLEDWSFGDPSGTQLNAVTNLGTVGTAWSNGGPRTQNGNLNIGDTTFWGWQVPAGPTFRAATFASPLTSGQYIFEFVIADWDLAGTDGIGTENNGIKFNFGSSSNGAAQLEFEVAQSPSNDIRVRSQNSNNGSLTGTDAQSQLGSLDLTNTAPVKVQLLADLDTGEWSTQVDYGTGFVPLVTNGTGMADIDRIQLAIEGGPFGWEWDNTNGTPTEFVQINSVKLSEDIPPVDPWIALEQFNFDDAAGLSFNQFVNSGTLGSSWNFGASAGIETDGAGSLAISNHVPGTFGTFRKISPPYAPTFSNGLYRLEMDIASWDFDTNAVGNVLTFGATSNFSTSQDRIAGLRLRVQDSSTARLQIFGNFGGTISQYRSFDYPMSYSNGVQLAMEFDFDADTASYYVDGIETHSWTNFTGSQLETLQFDVNSTWSSNNVVVIDAFGLYQENVAAPEPVLAVDFASGQINTPIQIEYFDVPLNLVTPAAEAPDYTGQPIYAGLELDPVSGKITGVDDGGTYTNGAAISFGSNGGAKLQWNGPFPGSPGDDFGRYEEDDVATGVFLFKREDFLNGLDSGTVAMAATNDTLSATVELNTGVDHPAYGGVDRLKSGQFRWVVQDGGSYYISAEAVNLTSDSAVGVTAEALDVSWFEYDPISSITNVSGAAAAPALQDIDAIGFWMSATVLTNDGNRTYPFIGCTSFEAQAIKTETVAGPFGVSGVQLISGNTAVQLTFDGLALGLDYKIQDSENLVLGFSDVAGSEFTATNETAHVEVLPADTATQPNRFFQALEVVP